MWHVFLTMTFKNIYTFYECFFSVTLTDFNCDLMLII